MGVVDMCGYVRMWWICMGVMDVSVLVVHFVCTLTSEPRANLECSDKRTPYHEVKMFISMVMRCEEWSCDVKHGHVM